MAWKSPSGKSPKAKATGRKPITANAKSGGPQPVASVRTGRPSALEDTRVIYCGGCLNQLRNLPDGCRDLTYIYPQFNSSRNYEVFWGETTAVRAFDDGQARATKLTFVEPLESVTAYGA